MYNTSHLYDLSFVAPNRRPRTKPQLVFTLDERHFEELLHRLQKVAACIAEEKYLDYPAAFLLPTPDLFGRIEFGYGRCGFVTRDGEQMSLRIELDQAKLHHAVLTIYVLTGSLLVPFDTERKSANRTQQIDINTNCVQGSLHGYGHSVGGYVSSEIVEWITRQWQKGPSDKWMHFTQAPEEVTTAMRQAFSAVVDTDKKRYTKDCGGSFTEDGRFILQCFGNACDVAIYPDSFYPDDGHGAQFSCHNLDNAYQQVTLLAGLAKMCELARQDF